jgi:hypothetical protein
MHPRTVATLNQLENATWFSRVGAKDTAVAIVLPSWQEAVVYGSSIDWQNLCLEAANQYRERLVERSMDRFEKWNDIAQEMKKITIPFVAKKIEGVVRANGLPKSFENAVQWDVLFVCMEAEYADVYPPGFFASNGHWYIQGHFPCGWRGDFPAGMLIIY